MKMVYTLTVYVPRQIDEGTLKEIIGNEDPRIHSLSSRIAFWLAPATEGIDDRLTEYLPDGWEARLSGPVVTP